MSKAAKEYLAKKKLERMEWNNARFAIAWLIVVILVGIAIFVFGPTNRANASELDAWEFRFFGINYKDFQERHWEKVVIGGVSSVVAHEVLGHMLASEMMGMGTPSFDFCDFVVYAGDGYDDTSRDQQAWYSASGLVIQSLGSILLTSIPATRHSDFTVGWNAVTMVTGTMYGITGGTKEDSSDVQLMNDRDWPGTEIAYGTGLIGGITTYISLDKED